MKVEGTDLSGDAKTELVTALKTNLLKIKADIQDAKKDVIKSFPMDTAVPFVFLFYATQFSKELKFDNKMLEAHLSLEHLNFLKKSQVKQLKQIESVFDKETSTNGDDLLAQIYLDDNFFNSFTSLFTTIEKMFSLRDFAKSYPKAKQFLSMATTTMIGKVLPSITDQYGENKKVDVVFSPSHSLFMDGVPKAKPTGMYMDKNGNFKAQINIPA